jgi:hypothetical protein
LVLIDRPGKTELAQPLNSFLAQLAKPSLPPFGADPHYKRHIGLQ